MNARRFVALMVAVVALAAARPAFAQAPAGEAPPMTAAPWQVPLEELRAEIRPLRVAELEDRLSFWMDAYQESVAEAAQLGREGAAGAGALSEATGRKAAIAERLGVVLASYEAKGGDGTEYRKFMAATSQIDVNLFDPQAVGAFLRTWIVAPEGGIKVGLNILWFVVIIVATWFISVLVAGAVRTSVRRLPKASSLLQDFLVGGAKRIVLLIGIVIAVSYLGVNVTPLVAAIGAAGLVIGLALQGTLSNFASGILILVYRPYDVGDVIEGGGTSGKVEAMNLVSTRIATFDNQVMYVPNNQIWNGVIKNITARDTRRVDLTVGVAYGSDLAKVEAIIRDILSKHEKVLPEPAPNVKVGSLADNSINMLVRPWSKTADYWDVYWDVTRALKERFEAEGIGIPFPQRDLTFSNPVEVVLRNK